MGDWAPEIHLRRNYQSLGSCPEFSQEPLTLDLFLLAGGTGMGTWRRQGRQRCLCAGTGELAGRLRRSPLTTVGRGAKEGG